MNKTTKESLIEEKMKEIENKCWKLPDNVCRSQRLTEGQIEIIKQALSQAHTAGRQERTAEVVEMVEGMRKELPILGAQSADDMMEEEVHRGYNQALTDIRNHLTE